MTPNADTGGRYQELYDLAWEMFPYVPEYFVGKWQFDERLTALAPNGGSGT